MADRMTWAEVSPRRLDRAHLADGTATDDAARICADVLGVHAQVMSAAELSIGLRSETLTRFDVRDALWQHKILVKTRGPRGTVHLVATEDLPMWTGALSALPRGRRLYLNDEQVERIIEAIDDAVAERELTVDELTDAVVERAGPWAGDRVMDAFQDKWPRWREAESLATSRGVLCFGAGRARRTTYTSPRRWLPGFAPMPAEEALSALVRRFLWAYGPATPGQLARWLAVPPAWAAALFASRSDLDGVQFDGATAWINADDVEVSAPTASLRLLPYFDSYLINCFPREALYPGPAAARALTGGQAGNVPALLIDGRVAGVWHQRRSPRAVAITVEPLARLTGWQRDELRVQAVRIGKILDCTPKLTIGKVDAGAHA